ncbi:MAG: aminotransferase class I and II [Bacteroidetes bacterium]|nr:aminotransferase class I and II [Bacteroidota bacterium]MCW5894752.1 aminotransferase class I and II [Bacteroidota bacterium]
MPHPPTIRTVNVTRYVTPLREGSSLPAIVEADDDGLYVLKFRGAGQGVKALIAELIAGEIARTLGLRVPEIVFATLDVELSRLEPDPEIQDLLRASAGLNLAIDYLPGAVAFNPVVTAVESRLASQIVWLDIYLTNVDRTPRNANLLVWHKNIWLIDHGASLYFHHVPQNWNSVEAVSRRPFEQVKDHILLNEAHELAAVDEEMRASLPHERLSEIVRLIPDEWLTGAAVGTEFSAEDLRRLYTAFLTERLRSSNIFLEEARRARERSV